MAVPLCEICSGFNKRTPVFLLNLSSFGPLSNPCNPSPSHLKPAMEMPADMLTGTAWSRSHKGSHLALLVELLTGGLACGAMTQKAAAGNWANVVVALDPALLGPAAGFRSRATALLEAVKAAVPIPGGPGVWLPGERGDAQAGDRSLSA